MVLGKFAQGLANGMGSVLWHIYHGGLDWLLAALSRKTIKLWHDGVYQEALLLHLLCQQCPAPVKIADRSIQFGLAQKLRPVLRSQKETASTWLVALEFLC